MSHIVFEIMMRMTGDNVFWYLDVWIGKVLLNSFWKGWWIVFLNLLLSPEELSGIDDFDRHRWRKWFLSIWMAHCFVVDLFRIVFYLLNLWLIWYWGYLLAVVLENPCCDFSNPILSCSILIFLTSHQRCGVILPKTGLHVLCCRWLFLCCCFSNHSRIEFCRQ